MEVERSVRRYLVVSGLVLVMMCCVLPEAVADLPKSLTGDQGVSAASPEEFSTAGAFVQMLGAFLLCLGVFAAGIHLYRRYGGVAVRPAARRMSVVERLAVTHKSALYLVSLDGKEFLVTSGPDNLRIAAAPAAAQVSFDESLAVACQDEGVCHV
jgi:flagellar biogenesis protein FliO